MKKMLFAGTVSLLLHSIAFVNVFIIFPTVTRHHEKIQSFELVSLVQPPDAPPKLEKVKPPVRQNRPVPVVHPEPIAAPPKAVEAFEPSPVITDTVAPAIVASAQQLSNSLPVLAEVAGTPDAVYSDKQLKGGLIPINKSAVPYPMVARDREIEGFVEVFFIVGHTGTVEQVSIQKITHPVFKESVLKVVPTWRFRPPTIDSRPVRIKAVQRIEFKLDG